MSTEIEKLERRWQDNPRGLTFAPLAEAYRKNGALARALELLDSGLAQHPGYVPAHIVRGRCHLDAGERALAELDFLCVSELDPENVIALKALADLAEEEGRTSDAIRRLESLLEIDRNNDEAEGQLERLRADQAPLPEPLVEAPPAARPATGGDFIPRNDSAALTPSEVRLEGIEILELERHLPQASQIDSSLMTAPTEIEQPAGESMDAILPGGELADLPEELTAWLEDPIEAGAAVEPVLVEADALAAEPEAAQESEPPPQPEPAAQMEEPVTTEAESEPELVVTETMAEIFLRQGHRELALAVYSQLLQREPDNPRIAAASAALAESLAPPPPPPPPPAPEPAPEPVKQFDAASTGGPSVGDFLSVLLSTGRPRPATTIHPPVFDREEEAKAPSFDEFFATEAPPAPASAAHPPVPATQRAEVGPRTGEAEELEQFHAWLRGLKS